jgi:hypothetical protein
MVRRAEEPPSDGRCGEDDDEEVVRFDSHRVEASAGVDVAEAEVEVELDHAAAVQRVTSLPRSAGSTEQPAVGSRAAPAESETADRVDRSCIMG